MKHILFACALLLVLQSRACDVCGTVSSNASIGLFASNRFHILGLQSSYRSMTTYLYDVRHSREHIISTDFRFRFQLHRRFQLLGFVPYQYAYQQTDFGKNKVQGLGDASLMGNFIAINKRDSNGMSRNFLTVAAGVKLPSGKNAQASDPLKNIYPGTGSWDLTLLANYTHQFDSKWGWQSEGSFSIKGKDRFDYSYGNSYQLTSQAVYKIPVLKYRMISALGLNGEYHEKAKPVNLNQGYILALRGAVNLMSNNWLISVFFQQPLAQDFNNGLSKQGISCGLNINYLINK